MQTDSGTDTLYYDQDTEITQNALQQGREVTIKYEMSGDRKVIKEIAPANTGNGGEAY